jgi:hypothetical protein
VPRGGLAGANRRLTRGAQSRMMGRELRGMGVVAMNCSACGGRLRRSSARVFGPVVTTFGYALLVPPALGVCFAALVLEAALSGPPPVAGGVILAAVIAGASAVFSLFGFLLSGRRRVLRCDRCPAVYDDV